MHPELRSVFQTKDFLFWLGLTVLAAGAWWLLGRALAPFLVGLGLAYVLNPLVVRLRFLGFNRTMATLLVILVFFFGSGYLAYRLAPFIAQQGADFLKALPATVARLQAIFDAARALVEERLGMSIAAGSNEVSINQLLSTAVDWLTRSLTSVGATGKAVLNSIEFLIIVPFAVFYFLTDWERLVRALQRLVPVSMRASVFSLTAEIDAMLGGYFRGQALVCLFLGTFYALALWIIGLNYGVLIGVISGILAFIPYLGSATCLVLAFGFGIAQFWPDWTMLALIGGIIGVGQFIEGNFLTPLFVGRHVGLHPLTLMFGLIALGNLYGFVGLLLSVPITGTLAIVLRRLAAQYRASTFFRQS